jgi:hypothetical protein
MNLILINFNLLNENLMYRMREPFKRKGIRWLALNGGIRIDVKPWSISGSPNNMVKGLKFCLRYKGMNINVFAGKTILDG